MQKQWRKRKRNTNPNANCIPKRLPKVYVVRGKGSVRCDYDKESNSEKVNATHKNRPEHCRDHHILDRHFVIRANMKLAAKFRVFVRQSESRVLLRGCPGSGSPGPPSKTKPGFAYDSKNWLARRASD